jgi:hypothetical protein
MYTYGHQVVRRWSQPGIKHDAKGAVTAYLAILLNHASPDKTFSASKFAEETATVNMFAIH